MRRAVCVFLPGSQNQGLYDHEETLAENNILSRGQTVLGIDEAKAIHVPLKGR